MIEHQAVFVNALRCGPQMRKRIFDVIEEHHAPDFRNGRAGIELYEDLLSALADSRMPEVVKEFERRFSPLLKRDSARGKADRGPREEMTDVATAVRDRRSREWVGMSILYVAAFFAAFVVAFSAFRMTADERPSMTAVTIPAATAAASVSEATTEPLSLADQKLSLEE